jgi:hypothetical protein
MKQLFGERNGKTIPLIEGVTAYNYTAMCADCAETEFMPETIIPACFVKAHGEHDLIVKSEKLWIENGEEQREVKFITPSAPPAPVIKFDGESSITIVDCPPLLDAHPGFSFDYNPDKPPDPSTHYLRPNESHKVEVNKRTHVIRYVEETEDSVVVVIEPKGE